MTNKQRNHETNPTHANVHIRKYKKYKHTCIHIRICVYPNLRIYNHTNTKMGKHTLIQTYEAANTHLNKHAYINTHIHVYTYTSIYRYTHTHLQIHM